MNDIHNQLNNDGYVILDILNADEIKYLNTLCEKYLSSTHHDFVAGSHFLDKATSDFINQELHKILKEKMLLMFPNLELLGGTLATKAKGKSILKAHNDWDIVDESKYNSYNLWLALVDTNTKNGTLGLIPNSHLWQHKHRGMNINSTFENFTNQLIKIGIEPNLKAGQAILYNHRLIHYSKPNNTNQLRNVVIIGMKDRDASLQVSFSIHQDTIDTYQIKEEDFYPFNLDKIKQNGQLINQEKDVQLYQTWDEIYNEYHKYTNKKYKKEIKNNFISNFKEKITKILLR